MIEYNGRLVDSRFNTAYDKVIIPYDHIDTILKLHKQFTEEYYSSAMHIIPFQDEGIILDYNHSSDMPGRVVQWERIDDDLLSITCSVMSPDNEYPEITLYEGTGFPVVGHKVEVPTFWFKFKLSTRMISELQCYIASEEPRHVIESILTPDVQRAVLNKCIYENEIDLDCVGLAMFVFWYASRSPERIEHDASKDEHRSKREIKEIKNHHGNINRKIPLVKKVFTLQCTKSDIAKIKRTAPDHKVHVRGHYRRYKNGRTIYINPFTKYNDKPDTHSKTYVV